MEGVMLAWNRCRYQSADASALYKLQALETTEPAKSVHVFGTAKTTETAKSVNALGTAKTSRTAKTVHVLGTAKTTTQPVAATKDDCIAVSGYVANMQLLSVSRGQHSDQRSNIGYRF